LTATQRGHQHLLHLGHVCLELGEAALIFVVTLLVPHDERAALLDLVLHLVGDGGLLFQQHLQLPLAQRGGSIPALSLLGGHHLCGRLWRGVSRGLVGTRAVCHILCGSYLLQSG